MQAFPGVYGVQISGVRLYPVLNTFSRFPVLGILKPLLDKALGAIRCTKLRIKVYKTPVIGVTFPGLWGIFPVVSTGLRKLKSCPQIEENLDGPVYGVQNRATYT